MNDLTLLKDNYKKVLENQQSILMAIAYISVKFDTLITGKYKPQVTSLNDAMKKTPDNKRLCLKPIRIIEEPSNLEAILNDGKMKEDYKIKYSVATRNDNNNSIDKNCCHCVIRVIVISRRRAYNTQPSATTAAVRNGVSPEAGHIYTFGAYLIQMLRGVEMSCVLLSRHWFKNVGPVIAVYICIFGDFNNVGLPIGLKI